MHFAIYSVNDFELGEVFTYGAGVEKKTTQQPAIQGL
jgi:hypothetical protein